MVLKVTTTKTKIKLTHTKIPTEMEVAPPYKLLTLFTLFTLLKLFLQLWRKKALMPIHKIWLHSLMGF